uniref:Uncharacterized protein n=1 Tax=Tanacetum cinerariifolium TaxID=118510 RepID=A0A699IFU6_TANCI|nr:hypothetical protein [Tanacetum cinerariifolium]
MRKASSDYPSDGMFLKLQENDGDDDNDLDNGITYEELNDKDPSRSNLGFGFRKVNLDDFDKQPSGSKFRRMEVLNQGPLTPDRMPTRASNKKLFARHLKLYGNNRHDLDCGLVIDLELHFDMPRRLRFKFSIKILLHEINMHAEKMLQLSKEFNKVNSLEKLLIIIQAIKNREQHERI